MTLKDFLNKIVLRYFDIAGLLALDLACVLEAIKAISFDICGR